MVRLSISLSESEYFLLKHWAKKEQTSMSRVAGQVLKEGFKNYALQFAYDDLKGEIQELRQVLKGEENEKS